MKQNVYEGLFIFDSNRYSRDAGGVSGQIAEFVKKFGGEVLVTRLWEERRLAYPIKGHRKGTYWLTYFRLPNTQLVAFERECRLSESIMRSLVLKIDARIVDALVTHAKASLDEAGRPRRAEPAAAPAAVTAAASAVADLSADEMEPVGEQAEH